MSRQRRKTAFGLPKISGVLVTDGTYINVRNAFAELAKREHWYSDDRFLHKMLAILSIDYHTRDLPHYSLGDNENKIDLVLHFEQLKELGYPLAGLVRDGNDDIEKAAIHVYGKPIPTQSCHHHFLDKFDKKAAEKGCTELERQHIAELRMRICLIIRVPTIDIACQRVGEFAREKNRFKTSEATAELVEKFLANFEYLTEYLQHPKGWMPTTVNVCENMNKQLKDRIGPMCMFQSMQSAADYLKLWCLKRRFQKFTDCKKPFRHLNGKAPLELAGCHISQLDYLNL